MTFTPIITAGIALGVMGLLFGCILAYASKIFAVEVDERIPAVQECLPGANCGGCGFAGCSAAAGAIVAGKAPVNVCPVGGAAAAEKIAAIMGVTVEAGEKKVAHVMCCGDDTCAKKKCEYIGLSDCVSAMRFAGGSKMCMYGCCGLGSCVQACKFDALHIVNGIAVVDEEKCVACGACVSTCPRHLIQLVPASAKVHVECMNKDKGVDAKGVCDKACIGCMLCQKNCPEQAITVTNFNAAIDYSKCTGCGTCVSKCPRKCIILKEDGSVKVENPISA